MIIKFLLIFSFFFFICPNSAEESGFYLDLSGYLGYYTLPEKIQGYVDDYSSTYDRLITGGETSEPGGYQSSLYYYKHTFSSRIRPNIGMNYALTYYFSPYLGISVSYRNGFSIRDHIDEHTYKDTVPRSYSTSIPHDFAVEEKSVRDHIYMKNRSYGLAFEYSHVLNEKMNLYPALEFGRVSYLQIFRIEYKSVYRKYYQNNGNQVYADTGQSYFDAFGINYKSFHIKPRLGVGYHLNRYFILKGGLSYTVAYIENGYKWDEGYGTEEYPDFYPSSRFFAGNLSLFIGLKIKLFKGKKRKDEQIPAPKIQEID